MKLESMPNELKDLNSLERQLIAYSLHESHKPASREAEKHSWPSCLRPYRKHQVYHEQQTDQWS